MKEEITQPQTRQGIDLERLRRAGLRLTASLQLQSVFSNILDQCLQLVPADDAHIFIYDGQDLSFGAAKWAGGRQVEPFSTPREDGLTYAVARSGKTIVVPDVNRHELFRDWKWGGSIAGLPLMIGSKLANPGRFCLNFMGDGAFGMSGLDLETSVRAGAPITTVVLNNGGMGGYDRSLPTALEVFGTSKMTGDYSKVAEGLGAVGIAIHHVDLH